MNWDLEAFGAFWRNIEFEQAMRLMSSTTQTLAWAIPRSAIMTATIAQQAKKMKIGTMIGRMRYEHDS